MVPPRHLPLAVSGEGTVVELAGKQMVEIGAVGAPEHRTVSIGVWFGARTRTTFSSLQFSTTRLIPVIGHVFADNESCDSNSSFCKGTGRPGAPRPTISLRNSV